MILVEAVSQERGVIDMDRMCLAELQAYYWASIRRSKFQTLQRVKSMKKPTEYSIVYTEQSSSSSNSNKESLRTKGLTDVNAFMEFYAGKGIDVVKMM